MGEKPKIAIVANSTWNIYNFRLSLIKTLKAAGFRVIVIAPVDEYIHYLNDNYFTKHIPLRRMKAQRQSPLMDILLLRELYRIYRAEKPDMILHFTVKPNIYGSIAASMAGIKSVSTITGLGYSFLNTNLLNTLVRPLYRRALRKNKHVIFHNHDDAALFEKEGLVKESQSLVVGGSGVDMGYFSPVKTKNKNKFIYLFVGRLLKDKGIFEFIHAARQLQRLTKRAECWVIGELNDNNPSAISKYQVLNWVSEKSIRYFGHVRDVRKYLAEADVLVLPSYREGLSRATLEAMAMEKPIITSDVAGCRETVNDGVNGFLVAPKDATALAEAMLDMYQLEDEAIKEMGRQSRLLCLNQFDVRLINLKYLELVRGLLNLSINVEDENAKSGAIL